MADTELVPASEVKTGDQIVHEGATYLALRSGTYDPPGLGPTQIVFLLGDDGGPEIRPRADEELEVVIEDD